MLRMSGIAVGVCVYGSSIYYLLAQKTADEVIADFEELDMASCCWSAFRFIIALPFSFHLFNGIRHLCFFSGGFLQISKIYLTGYLVMFFSILFAIYLAFINETNDYIKEQME